MEKNELREKVKEIEKLSIFKELCPKQKLQLADNCHICKAAVKKSSVRAGLGLKEAPFCKFCGNSACVDCLPKKRRDPADPNDEEYHSICSKCEELYLMRRILTDFCGETQALEQEMEIKASIKEHQEQRYNTLLSKISVNNNKNLSKYEDNATKLKYLDEDIGDVKDKLENIKKKIEALRTSQNTIDQTTDFAINTLSEREQRLKELKQTAVEFEERGFAVSEDIAELSLAIDRALDKIKRITVGGNRPTTSNLGGKPAGAAGGKQKKKSLPTGASQNSKVTGKSNYPCTLI